MPASKLPSQFGDLEDIVEGWSLPTEFARHRRRLASSSQELIEVYNRIAPRLGAILDHVDQFPLDGMPEDSCRLFYLAMSLAEIAPHVELYGGSVGVPYSFEETRLVGGHVHDPF